jgi:hypothetical protein
LFVAIAAATAAIANLIENGVGIESAGGVYFVSILVMMFTMLALGRVVFADTSRWSGAL